jgi:hypothetical protein
MNSSSEQTTKAYLISVNKTCNQTCRKAMTRLMGLQFKVVYRKGKENCAADALSRMVHLHDLQAVSEVKPMWL